MTSRGVVRTPDERFKNLAGFNFEPRYCQVFSKTAGLDMRMHYIDEGPRNATEVVVCVHGNPHWCYVWRQTVPILVDAGFRVICPDNIGCGRSDKPEDGGKMTYAACVEWCAALVQALDLKNITWVLHDFGGPLGLRVALQEVPDRTARIVVTNTILPAGDIPRLAAPTIRAFYQSLPTDVTIYQAFTAMQKNKTAFGSIAMAFGLLSFAATRRMPALENTMWQLLWTRLLSKGDFMQRSLFNTLDSMPDEEIDAYLAPFPGSNVGEDRSQLEQFLSGMRRFPTLLPLLADGTLEGSAPDDLERNKACWEELRTLDKPLLTLFSDSDPAFKDGDKPFLAAVAHARQAIIRGAGHTAQDGPTAEEFASAIVDFISTTRGLKQSTFRSKL